MSNLDFFDMFNLYFGGAPASLVRPEGVASRPYGVKNSAAAKARAGREFLSPNPFPSRPARASGFVPAAPAARQSVNFVQNRFGFGCINAPISNFHFFCRAFRRRFVPPYTGKLARRAERDSPNRGSYSLRF